MEYVIVGLGNPGEEYENTRHNVGRMVVQEIAHRLSASEWRTDKKLHAQIAHAGTEDGKETTLVLPDNYMNRSGGSVAPLVKNRTQNEHLIVVHDDIDLPIGTLRIVFDRGAGGHRGVESIVRALKTRAFVRVRVGVVPTTPTGKMRKPRGEGHVHNFILQQLSKRDTERIQRVVKRAAEAVLVLLQHGRTHATQKYNATVDITTLEE